MLKITITDDMKKEIADLAEVDGNNIGTITLSDDNKVDSLTYTKKGKTCTYTRTPETGKEKYSVAKAGN